MNKLLLHTCCAPCSIAAIDELRQKFDVTVFFYNPNIYPAEEYLKRKKEIIRVCEEWGTPMVDGDYEEPKWRNYISGLENEPEGGARCSMCFKMRLNKAAYYAKHNGFDYFSTSLTSGRNKDAEKINPLGDALGVFYGVNFYAEDWKKGGRQEKAKKMIGDRGIYRQNYCGCIFSLQNSLAGKGEKQAGIKETKLTNLVEFDKKDSQFFELP